MKVGNNRYRPELFLERLENVKDLNGFKTNKALSEATGISEGTISKWKRNNTLPDTDTLTKICNGCKQNNVDIDYLLGRIDTLKHENHSINQETGLDEDAIEKLRKYKHEGTLFAVDTTDNNTIIEYYDPANSFVNHAIKCDEMPEIMTIANEQKKLRKLEVMLLEYPGYKKFKDKYDHLRSIGGPLFAKNKLIETTNELMHILAHEPIPDEENEYIDFIDSCQEFNLPSQLVSLYADKIIDFEVDLRTAAEEDWPSTETIISILISIYRAEMVYRANMDRLNRLFSDVIESFTNNE